MVAGSGKDTLQAAYCRSGVVPISSILKWILESGWHLFAAYLAGTPLITVSAMAPNGELTLVSTKLQ
jgi:hypothetical protein